MKRFIDLRPSDAGPNFAFYCTIVNKFEQFGEDQAWESIFDFIESFLLSCKNKEAEPEELGRYLMLLPDWILLEDYEKPPLEDYEEPILPPDMLKAGKEMVKAALKRRDLEKKEKP